MFKVAKWWHYDVYPECKEEKAFQEYQTAIRRNFISFSTEHL